MPNTNYSEVNDLFMLQVTDYQLINLFTISETDFTTYVQGFMILAIPEFNNCTQNLNDRNDTTKTFNFQMNQDNIVLLAKLMVKQWLNKEVNNVNQMRLHIQDKDFKTFAEANNLNAKKLAYNMLREECSTDLTTYGYNHNNWAAWANGVYAS